MELERQITSILFVFLLLGGALWLLRRRGLASFGPLFAARRASCRRMTSVERLVLSPQHTLHLVRIDGREMVILAHATGGTIVQEKAAEAHA